MNFIVIMK